MPELDRCGTIAPEGRRAGDVVRIHGGKHGRSLAPQYEAAIFDRRTAGKSDLIEAAGLVVGSGRGEIPPGPSVRVRDGFTRLHRGDHFLVERRVVNTRVAYAAKKTLYIWREMSRAEQDGRTRAVSIRLALRVVPAYTSPSRYTVICWPR